MTAVIDPRPFAHASALVTQVIERAARRCTIHSHRPTPINNGRRELMALYNEHMRLHHQLMWPGTSLAAAAAKTGVFGVWGWECSGGVWRWDAESDPDRPVIVAVPPHDRAHFLRALVQAWHLTAAVERDPITSHAPNVWAQSVHACLAVATATAAGPFLAHAAADRGALGALAHAFRSEWPLDTFVPPPPSVGVQRNAWRALVLLLDLLGRSVPPAAVAPSDEKVCRDVAIVCAALDEAVRGPMPWSDAVPYSRTVVARVLRHASVWANIPVPAESQAPSSPWRPLAAAIGARWMLAEAVGGGGASDAPAPLRRM